MSEEQNYGFGKFVPGFDFLQNLAKGATQAQAKAGMPNLSNWIAPTLNVEELDKRISELKAVNFWLDQNSRALGATIQALELQKMTLVTLKGMNFNMSEIAEALKLKTDGADTGSGHASEAAASGRGDTDAQPSEPPGSVAGAAKDAVAKARASKKSAQEAGEPQEEEGTQQGDNGPREPRQASGVVDPLQWWGALTQQFQEIASSAMREAANNPAIGAAREMASGAARQAVKAAAATADAASGKAARKSSGGASGKTASGGKSAGAKKSARKSPAPSR